jgi:hypothetical protein
LSPFFGGFFKKAGPEGLGIKNFEIWTQGINEGSVVINSENIYLDGTVGTRSDITSKGGFFLVSLNIMSK